MMSSRKLVPQPGQQGLETYIHCTPKGSKETLDYCDSVKKRTPPSTERPTKRRVCEVPEKEYTMENPTVTPTPEAQMNNADAISKTEAERKAQIYKHFSPEMIECLREDIKEIQQLMDRKRDTLIEIQNKQREQDDHIRELTKQAKEEV